MIRLALRVRRAEAELVLAELLELAPGGVEEVDCGDDLVEYAVYGPPGEIPALPDLRAAAGGAFVEVSTTEVADDWAERWREFHQPIVVGSLRVRAPWHDGDGIVIDPGQAFGTGAHPTTSLCLGLLQEVEPAGALVDAGCGSGVLAIAAARLGFAPVTALDFDPLAVEATRANAQVNGVDVATRRWDLRHEPLTPAPTVCANLLRPLLLELAGRLASPPDTLIASGLLSHEGDEVVAAFAGHGFAEVRRAEADGWCALLLTR